MVEYTRQRHATHPSLEKQYPGIFTAFLQKVRDGIHRGVHKGHCHTEVVLSTFQSDFFSSLATAVSADRSSPYRISNPVSESEAYAAYAWNIALCESLYPALNCLEISLRNSIHQAVSAAFGNRFWFRTQLVGREEKTIQDLDAKFASKVSELEPGDYISECSFGFWVGLFRGTYEQALWTSLLPAVFPYTPRRSRSRSELYARLDRIRRLRNRVFHHEPIWHLPDLPEQHQQIPKLSAGSVRRCWR